MCGIFACLFCGDELHPQLKAEILAKLKRRGPDAINEITLPVHGPSQQLKLIGSLLRMRGDPTPQPYPVHTSPDLGTINYLLWNGNIFGGQIKVPLRSNDTVALAQQLARCEGSVSRLLTTLSGIHGPWAIVYWQESTKSLWFGRDVFGRRSLLWHTPSKEDDRFMLCSVAHYSETKMPLGYWKEVPANGVYQLKCHGPNLDTGELICYPWMQGADLFQSDISIQEELCSVETNLSTLTIVNHCLQVPFPPLNKLTPTQLTKHHKNGPDKTGACNTCITSPSKYHQTCQESIASQLPILQTQAISTNYEKAKTPFKSDSDDELNRTDTACIKDSSGSNIQNAELSQVPLDAAPHTSVCMYPLSSSDWSVLSQQLLEILQEAVRVRVYHAPEVKQSATSIAQRSLSDETRTLEQSFALSNIKELQDLTTLASAASVSVEEGITASGASCSVTIERTSSNESQESKPPLHSAHTHSRDDLLEGVSDVACCGGGNSSHGGVVEGRARVAVLYSGGVDSTVLAALADRCLEAEEEIDLINIAFEQKSSPADKRYDVPDRVSAIESLKELNPHRKWNLIMVNVTSDEVDELRRSRVSHMVYPLCTVLDDSIGCALWFATRGVGLLYPDHHPPTLYHSQARTLFVGIGADEQLAGYSRHRTKFNSSGWEGLTAELEMEIKRLAKRNLGRDDRCVADHSREGQFPFLDENVVTFLQQLPACYKADLSLPRGQGEKRLLREVATHLCCHGAGQLPKRAIQFGSRIAKMSGTSNNREQGSSLTHRLMPGVGST